MFRNALCLGLVTSCAAVAGSPAPIQYASNLGRPVREQVCRAMRALERAQGTFPSAAGRSEASWEWTSGDGRAADNASGVVALALARSEELCGSRGALRRYAEARSAVHRSYGFLYDADVEALAIAAARSKDAALASLAREAFDRRHEGANGREIVERSFLFRSEPSLVGYDAAMAVRAALAVGRLEKAREIADAALAVAPRWSEGEDPFGYRTTSRGALLEALAMLDAKSYRPRVTDLLHHLALTQGKDGSWAGRNTQATAYAVRGLSRWSEEFALSSAARGRRWLRLTQLKAGPWATYNDLVPEPFVGPVVPAVTAEVLLALVD
ncbi:MAG: hypothetical protein HYZ28_22540 [Myxococcales bacterium]|nr:hypothetical protein [Myxococcales bacterium]